MGLERVPQYPTTRASPCVGTAPERGHVAVAVKEATAVSFSCLLYSWGLFLGWREAAAWCQCVNREVRVVRARGVEMKARLAPWRGEREKKSVQIKKHEGNGSRAWRRWRGRRGKRLLSPCKSFGKTEHHPPLIPLIKTTLVCRCQGQAAVFKEALAPPGPCLPGSGGSIWR